MPTLTLVVVLYVSLDLSSPFVAGAFQFDPDECVEVVQRASSASQRGDAPALCVRAPAVRREPAPSSPARPLAWRRSAVLSWLADAGASHRASGDPSPPARPEDH